MLETYILTGGNGVEEALKEAGEAIAEEVKEVNAAKDTPHGEVVKKFGLPCRKLNMQLNVPYSNMYVLYAVDKGLRTWLKRPASVVIDSATYLLTITSPDYHSC